MPIDPRGDENKNKNELIGEIYDHTNIKNEISRSMLSSVYARNPNQYKNGKIGQNEVRKIFQNNVSWPKNYRP